MIALSPKREGALSFDDIIYGAPADVTLDEFADPSLLDFEDGPPFEKDEDSPPEE